MFHYFQPQESLYSSKNRKNMSIAANHVCDHYHKIHVDLYFHEGGLCEEADLIKLLREHIDRNITLFHISS